MYSKGTYLRAHLFQKGGPRALVGPLGALMGEAQNSEKKGLAPLSQVKMNLSRALVFSDCFRKGGPPALVP